MAMNFWEAQKRARKQTLYLVMLFILLTIIASLGIEFLLRYVEPASYSPSAPIVAILFLAITFLVALIQYQRFKFQGGQVVAESMNARLCNKEASDAEYQLQNIVEEMAVASSLPAPKIYIIPAKEINAFAAGLRPDDSVIAVTEGAIEQFSRDEMQAVIAHEFGHIHNGDMTIGLRLAAMLMGFYFVLYIGLRFLEISGRSRRSSREKGGNPVVMAALLFLVAGAFTWFFGSILKAAVSRQREYGADASSVQFTRNPQGLSSALKKIMQETKKDMPKSALSYSHLYFNDSGIWSRLFATHPPLMKRIEAIEGKE